MGLSLSRGGQLGLSSGGECPVAEDLKSSSRCPVPNDIKRSTPIYNVYNQRIDGKPSGATPETAFLDPRNNMPLAANQQPYPGQRVLLPTERVKSTIPKGGTGSTWEYPSSQMFYNALRRKGKDEGIPDPQSGSDSELSSVMDSIVATHNGLNEMTWAAIQRWEALHPETHDEATLSRFVGRPNDVSPLAWLCRLLGGPAPFDRHDWYILRGGKEIRYVIDFYFDDSKAGSAEAFSVSDRPALDTVENGVDRIKMSIHTQCAKWGVPCPVTGHRHAD